MELFSREKTQSFDNLRFFWKCSISQFSLREEEDYSIFRINHDVFTAANSQRQNNVICQEL